MGAHLNPGLSGLSVLFGQYKSVYPDAGGKGAAVVYPSVSSQANNETDAAATAKDYWGEPSILIPRDTVAGQTEILGLMALQATVGKYLQYQVIRGHLAFASDKSGGVAWDEGGTALTVADGSVFADDDMVIVYSDYAVEIMLVNGAPAGKVVTVERETVALAHPTGLRWNHTTNAAGTESIYVVDRAATQSISLTQGVYSATASGVQGETMLSRVFSIDVNEPLAMRIVNTTDSIDCAVDVCTIIQG
jgi:hypothetical protein